jgi:hypothetical protein
MLKRRLLWLFVWGIAFAYIEASVVVYLRRIYYPAGFAFPVVIIEPDLAAVELVREMFTLVIMWAVAEIMCRAFLCRLAVFMFLFGVWDIFYYVFLKVILNWPAGISDWDILFLVPLPWVGPVWAPVAVSAAMIWAGSVILARDDQGRSLDLTKSFYVFEFAAGLIIIISFLIPGRAVISETVPQHFPWYIFLAGLGGGTGAFWWKIKNSGMWKR